MDLVGQVVPDGDDPGVPAGIQGGRPVCGAGPAEARSAWPWGTPVIGGGADTQDRLGYGVPPERQGSVPQQGDGEASTVPGRQLGRLLGELRAGAGMSVEVAARAVRFTPQKLWRIERGVGPVRGREVRAVCEMYGVPADLAGWLIRLAAEAGSKGWWRSYSDPPPGGLDLYAGLEAGACRLREYQHALIPALLQTREYACALLAQPPVVPESERGRVVEARLRRQVLLHRSLPEPTRFGVVLSEVVLRIGGLGSAVMREQLRHLIEVGRLPHVSIRVMPLAAGPHLGSLAGPFVLLDFPARGMRLESAPPVVYQHWLTGELYLDRPAEIAAYEEVWASLNAIALDEEQSRDLIDKISQEARA